MSRHLVTALLVGAIIAMFALPLLLDGESEYAGTDSQATELVTESDPGYEPWFDSVFSPGSSEIESGLFALQAALGGGVLGYVLGRLRGRRAAQAQQATAQQTTAQQASAPVPAPPPGEP